MTKKYGWIPLVFIFGLAVVFWAGDDVLPTILVALFGGIVIQQLWSHFVEEK